MEFIDLSHDIYDGLITYKGLPAPIICDFWEREKTAGNYDDGSTFQIGKIEMVANTGTYMDCPFHRYADGHDLAGLLLEHCAKLETLVIDAPFEKNIEVGLPFFKNKKVTGKAILINTGWSKFFGTESYSSQHPYLTEEAAIFLRDNGAKLVGIDSNNIDDTRHRTRPVHTILLRENILIVEHMAHMDKLPKNKKMFFSAVPPKIKGMGTFPVRAYVSL